MELAIDTPYEACKTCKLLDIKTEKYFEDGVPSFYRFTCENSYICDNFAKLIGYKGK